MGQEAANGRLIREVIGGAGNQAANQSRQKDDRSNSLTEAGKVSGTFGHKLDERMNAYTGILSDFGCPGNTVDQWRIQFTGHEAGFKAANTKRRS